MRPPNDKTSALPAEPGATKPEPSFPEAKVAAEARRPELPGYEILGELGRGGMGVVYKARQIALKRVVALKMILAGAHASAEQRERFFSEARAVARLQHPNIVQIHDIGEHEGRPYFSLEFVGGGNLAQKLDGTPLPPRQAAALLSTLAGAMQSAHEQNIVHRDLKPANVLLTEKNMPKITDFGLAKELDEQDAATRSGAIVGTPSYMAPEQALGRSREVGPHTDVYALGAILYEMLTGRPPIRGETPMDTMMQVVSQEPVAPTQLQPKIPRDLELICLKCLSKEPRKRFATAAQLAEELRRYLKGEPLAYTRPVGRAERTWRWCRRNPLNAVLAATVMLSLFSGTVLSSYYALSAHFAARRAEREKDRAEKEKDRADASAGVAEAAARSAEKDRFEAQLLSAGLALNQGQNLCEKGDVGRGLLWIAHSLRLIPQSAPDAAGRDRARALDRVVRANLAAWRSELSPLRASLERGGWVNAVDFSANGKLIVTASDDKTARLWDARTGAPVGEPLPHPHYVALAKFSPDGRTLLIAGWDGGSRLWDAARRQPIGPPLKQTDKARITAIAFSPNGNLVATGAYDGSVRLWNASTGVPIGEAMQHRGFTCLALSPDSQTLVTAGLDGAARFWDTATARPKGAPVEHKAPILCVAYHPDGKILVTGAIDFRARFWDTASNKPFGLPSLQHQGWVTAVTFSADGTKILTGSNDYTGRIWDAKSGQLIGVPLQHHATIRAIAFSPDSKVVATASADNSARLWYSATGRPAGSWLIHQGEVWGVAFHPDGKSVLTCSHDKTARLWHCGLDAPHPGLLFGAMANALALSPDGQRLVAGGSGKSPRLWSLDGPQFVEQPLVPVGATYAACFSPDGRHFATAHAKDARIWDMGSDKAAHILPHPTSVYTMAYHPTSPMVATGCEDGVARLWDASTGKLDDRLLRHPDIVYAVAFSPDGRSLATGCEDGGCRFWDLATGKEVGEPIRHPGSVKSLAFTSDGRTLVTGCADGAVRSWELATHRPAGPPLMHFGEITRVAIAPDGETILSGSTDGTGRLWDRRTGKQIGSPFTHRGSVNGVAFRRGGTMAVTASTDGTIQFWNLSAPMTGDTADLVVWAEVATGMTLNEEGVAQTISTSHWQKKRQYLERRGRKVP
jgi:WD40 repeat protein